MLPTNVNKKKQVQPRKIAPLRAPMVAPRDENVAATKQLTIREGALNNATAVTQKKFGVVTRKRAVLMDRTNVSLKQNTVNEQTNDIIKPIIKDENVINLGFPAVKSKEKHELSFDPTLITTAESEIYESEIDRKRSKKQKTQDWEDLDADDFYDPMMISEYAVDIFKYLKELETEIMPKPDYMSSQSELSWRMRGILVDWLIEVHHKFRLLPETLFLAVNIIDRFLSVRVVSLVKLQLVGITGLFIAAKYEELLAPSIKNFIYMADNGYTEEEILKAERYVLTTIDFKLCYPNPMNFLRRSSKADNFDIQARTVAKYLMEISLVDYKFLSSPPSMIAAAALYLSRKMLNRAEWHANLTHYSQYTEEELQHCENLMLQYLMKPAKHEQLYKKYAAKRFMKASIFVEDWIAKNVERQQ
ncbi:cyclin-like protein [Glomus cerebriforme]|uniref:Cyclin-like protein n=1 Tax=Glomus cerebriforme TaxID=658196 RepID=A0A397SB76_9GLOM|nr:cyclin-like protein [Glomus cerebriforme]